MTLLLFLPAEADDAWRWRRGEARGDGFPDVAADEAVIAVAPAADVTLHWAELPDRSLAQATAAARLLVAEASAAALSGLHVAVGAPEGDGPRPIAVAAIERMAGWLVALAARGVDPVAILPAPLLLPRPDEGFVRADPGGGMVLRGRTSAFADEPGMTALVVDGAVVDAVPADRLRAATAAAIETPPLNLRQGAFAQRRRRELDWGAVRRIALLGAMALAATLLIDVVKIARLSFDAAALEARADVLARGGLPGGAPEGDAGRLLDERLAGLRGPGRGFSPTLAQVFAVVREVGESSVTRIDFEPTGDLRFGLATEGEARANAVRQRLEASGFMVEASTFESQGSRLTGQMTVRVP